MRKATKFALLPVLLLSACGTVNTPANTNSLQRLSSTLERESVELPQGLIDMAVASSLAENKSLSALSTVKATHIQLQDPAGSYYGQVVSLDNDIADIYTGKGISSSAHTTIVGGTSIRSGVTMIQTGGKLLEELHTTVVAIGESPVKFVTFDGGSIMVQDKSGRLWLAGETLPLSEEMKKQYISQYEEIARSILSDSSAISELKAGWGIDPKESVLSPQSYQDSNYQSFMKGESFDYNLFISRNRDKISAQGLTLNYNYPLESYPGGGFEQNPEKWGRKGETYLYGSAINAFASVDKSADIIGCAPAAAAAALFAYSTNHVYTIDGKTYSNTKDDYKLFRQFAHEKVGNRGRLTGMMDGNWLNNGVMVWPGDFERGLSTFMNNYVRKPDGTTPQWVGGSRKVSATNDNDLLAALSVGVANKTPLIAGHWFESWLEGGHYSPVISARSVPRSSFIFNWHDIYVSTYDQPTTEYLISHRWNPFGALYAIK